MIIFLKSLFKKKNNCQLYLSANFDKQVVKAITLLSEINGPLDDEEALKIFVENNIEYNDAVEILLFLPIAFIRHWIPAIKWSDTYSEMTSDKNKVEKKFSETKSYQIIGDITRRYSNDNPDKDTIFKIGGRSAEFNAINPLLNANPDLKVEDIVLSTTVIIR